MEAQTESDQGCWRPAGEFVRAVGLPPNDLRRSRLFRQTTLPVRLCAKRISGIGEVPGVRRDTAAEIGKRKIPGTRLGGKPGLFHRAVQRRVRARGANVWMEFALRQLADKRDA